MALIRCPECGKMISEIAEKCNNCGCPIYIIRQQSKIKCPFCDSLNYINNLNCQNCGGELYLEKTTQNKEIVINSNDNIKEKKEQSMIDKIFHKKRFCRHCGFRINDRTNICPSCGKEMRTVGEIVSVVLIKTILVIFITGVLIACCVA